MAHDIEIIDGKASMLYVGEVPWHKLGTKFTTAPSLDEAIVAAGLNWKVGTKKLYTAMTNDDGTQSIEDTVAALATYRMSDKAILGVVGPTYQPLQNSEAFNFFKPFIESGEATIECAGSLKNGQRVFILAKIKKSPITIKGTDTVEKYILLSNSHDGTLAVRVGFTPIRTVCANTLNMAHSDAASKLLRIRHTKNVSLNLDKIREIMNVADAEFEATAEQYRFLANSEINKKDLEKYVKMVFSVAKPADNGQPEEITGNSRIVDKVLPLFEKGRGNDLPGIKGTYWAAYNAVTEYIQYDRGTNQEIRLDQTWFGAGQSLNKKALEVATQLAQAA